MGIYDRDWYRDAQLERRPRRRSGSPHQWWQKALVAVVVTLVAATALWAIRLWIVERTFREMQKTVVEATASIQQQAQAATQRALEEQRRQQELRQVQERIRRQSIADADSERARVYRAEVAERERKERAWERYYQPPPQCDSANRNIDLVDCANRHIRAKREFEAKYAAGRI